MDSLTSPGVLTQASVAAALTSLHPLRPVPAVTPPAAPEHGVTAPPGHAVTQAARTIVDQAVSTQAVASRQDLKSPSMASEAGRLNEQAGRIEVQAQPHAPGQGQTQSQVLSESPAIKPAPSGGGGARLDTRA